MDWKILGLATLIVCAIVTIGTIIGLLPPYVAIVVAFILVIAYVYIGLDTKSNKEE